MSSENPKHDDAAQVVVPTQPVQAPQALQQDSHLNNYKQQAPQSRKDAKKLQQTKQKDPKAHPHYLRKMRLNTCEFTIYESLGVGGSAQVFRIQETDKSLLQKEKISSESISSDRIGSSIAGPEQKESFLERAEKTSYALKTIDASRSKSEFELFLREIELLQRFQNDSPSVGTSTTSMSSVNTSTSMITTSNSVGKTMGAFDQKLASIGELDTFDENPVNDNEPVNSPVGDNEFGNARSVALRTIPASSRSRELRRENYITQILDYMILWESQLIFIVLEYADFGDLKSFLKKFNNGAKDQPSIGVDNHPIYANHMSATRRMVYLFEIFRQMFEGIASVHRKNVLHLDLKPVNYLVFRKKGSHYGFSHNKSNSGFLCEYSPREYSHSGNSFSDTPEQLSALGNELFNFTIKLSDFGISEEMDKEGDERENESDQDPEKDSDVRNNKKASRRKYKKTSNQIKNGDEDSDESFDSDRSDEDCCDNIIVDNNLSGKATPKKLKSTKNSLKNSLLSGAYGSTRTHMTLQQKRGTPKYIAPEVIYNTKISCERPETKSVVKKQSDYWSLGISGFYLLFNSTPFDSLSEAYTMMMIAIVDTDTSIEYPQPHFPLNSSNVPVNWEAFATNINNLVSNPPNINQFGDSPLTNQALVGNSVHISSADATATAHRLFAHFVNCLRGCLFRCPDLRVNSSELRKMLSINPADFVNPWNTTPKNHTVIAKSSGILENVSSSDEFYLVGKEELVRSPLVYPVSSRVCDANILENLACEELLAPTAKEQARLLLESSTNLLVEKLKKAIAKRRVEQVSKGPLSREKEGVQCYKKKEDDNAPSAPILEQCEDLLQEVLEHCVDPVKEPVHDAPGKECLDPRAETSSKSIVDVVQTNVPSIITNFITDRKRYCVNASREIGNSTDNERLRSVNGTHSSSFAHGTSSLQGQSSMGVTYSLGCTQSLQVTQSLQGTQSLHGDALESNNPTTLGSNNLTSKDWIMNRSYNERKEERLRRNQAQKSRNTTKSANGTPRHGISNAGANECSRSGKTQDPVLSKKAEPCGNAQESPKDSQSNTKEHQNIPKENQTWPKEGTSTRQETTKTETEKQATEKLVIMVPENRRESKTGPEQKVDEQKVSAPPKKPNSNSAEKDAKTSTQLSTETNRKTTAKDGKQAEICTNERKIIEANGRKTPRQSEQKPLHQNQRKLSQRDAVDKRSVAVVGQRNPAIEGNQRNAANEGNQRNAANEGNHVQSETVVQNTVNQNEPEVEENREGNKKRCIIVSVSVTFSVILVICLIVFLVLYSRSNNSNTAVLPKPRGKPFLA